MKRCPECRRDYYDETLLYCLDDGNTLLEGPASLSEPATAILSDPPTVPSGSTLAADLPDSKTEVLHYPAAAGGSAPVARRGAFHKRLLIVPLLVLLVASGGFFGYRYIKSADAEQIRSIAVMPFVNDSGSSDFDYLSDGMSETIITSLSQLPDLRVKPRSSVFRYKGKETDPQAVGRELQVQAILNGRVVQRGDNISLFVELVDVALDRVLWSKQYNRQRSNLVSLEHEIASDVTAGLKIKLTGAEEQKLSKTSTTDPEAYQLYLRGRFEWNKFSLEGLTKSISFFEQAIQIDPTYALAYSGLADSYVNLGVDFISPKDSMPKARLAALQAIALDDSLAEAHSSLGSYKLFFEWDTAGAESEYRKAISLDPNYANAHHFYSHCLQFSGREADALREMRTAVDLEPLSPLINAELAWAYYLARQNDASIAQSLKTLELDPAFAYSYFTLGMTYNADGKFAEALAELEKGAALAPDWLELQGELASTHALAGNRERAKEVLEKALAMSVGGYINEVIVASVYVDLGDNDEAMAWLERGYQNRCSWMRWISIEPKLDKLRSDPRFKDLVRRIGTI